MKNIMIITPFYPIPQKSYLKKDTDVVYSLCKNNNENERIVILYYYQHSKFAALKALPRILGGWNVDSCHYYDDFGHDVLLFEHPGILPRRYKTFEYFDNKVYNIVSDFLKKEGIVLDALIVHFPSRFTPLAKKIDAKKKTAILHSFDIATVERLKRVYDSIDVYQDLGFRSIQIQEKYLNSNPNQLPFFQCNSGIPDEQINPENINKPWKKNGVLEIVTVGKLIKRKNIGVIIQALSNLKDINFHYTIIGEGEELDNLKEMVKKCELNTFVTFTGGVPRDEVFEYLKKTDVFVLVSLRETLGLVYLEAIAQGNLVIASSGRGIDGMIEPNNGVFFIEPNDVKCIETRIRELDQMNHEQVQSLRENNYKFISNLKDSKVSRDYLERAIKI